MKGQRHRWIDAAQELLNVAAQSPLWAGGDSAQFDKHSCLWSITMKKALGSLGLSLYLLLFAVLNVYLLDQQPTVNVDEPWLSDAALNFTNTGHFTPTMFRGMHFNLRDRAGKASVPVVYRGSKPDLFRVGREVYLHGRLDNGVFVGERDSLVTKCPSKYAPAK